MTTTIAPSLAAMLPDVIACDSHTSSISTCVLLKGFHFGESKRLDLSLEAFNVTRNGNKNFANDAISIYGVPLADGSPSVPTAGQPLFAPSTARFGGPRQVQLGLRFVF